MNLSWEVGRESGRVGEWEVGRWGLGTMGRWGGVRSMRSVRSKQQPTTNNQQSTTNNQQPTTNN
ncbi:hypothetical protein [Fischerella thermalis]|uniref:hypothetical protein n=1 Tax=Fischerella thermalis TaxID=372787 RepID=UPI00307E6F9E